MGEVAFQIHPYSHAPLFPTEKVRACSLSPRGRRPSTAGKKLSYPQDRDHQGSP